MTIAQDCGYREDAVTTPHGVAHQSVTDAHADFGVLRSMLADLRERLANQDANEPRARPDASYELGSGGERRRTVIYRRAALQEPRPLAFVGFVSARSRQAVALSEVELQRTDQQLVGELASHSNLLCYLSREVLAGCWCNLVLFADPDAPRTLHDVALHRYAAAELAPRCYAWVRLHSGVLPDGVTSRAFDVRSSKFYSFEPESARTEVQVVSYP